MKLFLCAVLFFVVGCVKRPPPPKFTVGECLGVDVTEYSTKKQKLCKVIDVGKNSIHLICQGETKYIFTFDDLANVVRLDCFDWFDTK